MTCPYMTGYKNRFRIHNSQPRQNINAILKKNYIFLFSVHYLWRKLSSQNLRYLAALYIRFNFYDI